MASHWNRALLDSKQTTTVTETLQACLTDLVDLSLAMKQAHWVVQGEHFRSLHLHLDEIVDVAREASDDVAERLSALGVAPDGRAGSVAKSSRVEAYPPGFVGSKDTVRLCSDRSAMVAKGLRHAIEVLDEHDPVSQDLLIGICADLEKHLWMLQANEKE